jgi:hypothetical protein
MRFRNNNSGNPMKGTLEAQKLNINEKSRNSHCLHYPEAGMK